MPVPPSTALLLIDPYNDFVHPDGKLSPLVQASAKAVDTATHLKKLVDAARAAKIPIYYGLHQQYKEGFYEGWKHMTVSHVRGAKVKPFAEGSWGAEIYEGLEPDLSNGDVVVSKHWCSSAFANTDLDYQLRQREITRLVAAGYTTNTCLESTARYAKEKGYHVTLISDASAGFSVEMHDAAVKLVWPVIVDEVKTATEWAESFGA